MLFCGDAVPVEPEPAAELGPASSNFCAGRAGPPGFGREPGFLPGCLMAAWPQGSRVESERWRTRLGIGAS